MFDFSFFPCVNKNPIPSLITPIINTNIAIAIGSTKGTRIS